MITKQTDAFPPLDLLLQKLQDYPGIQLTITTGTTASTPFDEWARHWLKTWRLGQCKDNTYDCTYREPTETHLIPYFKQRPIHEITPQDVQEYFNAKAKACALESVKKQRTCLRGIFDTAVENGLCARSPLSRSVRIWSVITTPEKRAWTQAQYDIAFQFATHHPNGLAIMLLMETGISRSELLGLTWDDFDQEKQCLHIRNGLVECRASESGKWELQHDGLKNGYRRRSLPLSQRMTAWIAAKPRHVLIEHKDIVPTRVETTHIFHSPTGKAYAPHNWYRRQFLKFMHELHAAHPDIPALTTHELRHTRATLLAYQGVDIYTIARMLGHRDLTMLSRRYLHDNLEAMRKALGLAEDAR